jgi:Mg2+ and Co2+ transporter CorA
MKITAYDASESAELKELRETAALEKRADAPVWIDVTDYAPEELTEWLSSIRLDSDWSRACAEMSGRTRLEVADAEIFFELSVLGKGPRAVWQPMAFLCARGVVITIHWENGYN